MTITMATYLFIFSHAHLYGLSGQMYEYVISLGFRIRDLGYKTQGILYLVSLAANINTLSRVLEC